MIFRRSSNFYCYKFFFLCVFFADKSPFRAAGGRNTSVGQRALTESNSTDRTNKKESAAKPKDLYCICFSFLLLYLIQSFRQVRHPQSFQEEEIKARISFSNLLIRSTTRRNSVRRVPSCRYCPSLHLENKTCPKFPLRGPPTPTLPHTR